MLARVSSGKSGIVEYLKDGIKSGRELSRDELDNRITIDGNISITDKLIKELNIAEKDENYLHITLSFGERDLDQSKIIDAYKDYKKSIMSAYSSDEYNAYAEIHYPKVKSYTDKKTGEVLERFPHVHMVIPKKNLVSEKSLNPFGKYSNNIKYHDAIQETVNRKHGLESPYDNQRKYRMNDNAEFISRYKGDTFKGSNSELKNEWFDSIANKNIRSMDDFKKELSKYGEVSTGKAGAIDEYLQVKLTGKSKNIRLKENGFKPQYIENRELNRDKPSDKLISKNLNEWVDKRSHEMKHIHVASPKVRKQYNNLNNEQKAEFLNDRRNDFTRRYSRADGRRSNNNIRQGGRTADRKLSASRDGRRGFTSITNGLPSLPERNVVEGRNKRRENHDNRTQGLLSRNVNNHLERQGTRTDNKLRRVNDRGRGNRRGIESNKVISVSEQLLKDVQNKNSPEKIQKFKEIKRRLDPNRVLDHFEKTHGLVKSNYQTFKAKDGSARIKIDNKSYNISDFTTKHMHQDWNSTQKVLTDLYKKQLKKEEKDILFSPNGMRGFKTVKTGLPNKNLLYKKSKTKLADVNVKAISTVKNRKTIKSNIIDFHRKKARGLNTLKTGLPDKRLFSENRIKGLEARKEKQALNSIVFVSSIATKGNINKTPLSKVKQSVRLLKYLQKKERNGELKMAVQENTISSSYVDLKNVADSFKKQQEVIKQLSTKMQDLVPSQDVKNGKVEFNDKNTGKPVFQDVGTHIVMSDKKPTLDHVAVAMTFAAEKFGKVDIGGTKEFKKQVIEVAVAKNLNVVFADKKMQDQFIKERDNLKAVNTNKQEPIINPNDNSIKNSNVNTQDNNASNKQEPVINPNDNSIKNSNVNTQDNKQEPVINPNENNRVKGNGRDISLPKTETLNAEPIVMVSHGSAPYRDQKGDKPSYFVQTSDGKKQWGVGLKDAVEKSGASIGDEVKLKRTGSEDVQIKVPEKNENGKIVNVEKTVPRVEWSVDVIKKYDVIDNINSSKKIEGAIFPNESLDPKKLSDSELSKSINHKFDNINFDKISTQGMDKIESIQKPFLDEAEKRGIKTDLEKALDEKAKPTIKEQAENITKSIIKSPAEDQNFAKKEDLTTNYSWSPENNKMTITVNGKSTKDLPTEIIDTMRGGDKFLKDFSADQIRSGKLDISQSSQPPVPKTFNPNGVVKENIDIQRQENKQTQ